MLQMIQTESRLLLSRNQVILYTNDRNLRKKLGPFLACLSGKVKIEPARKLTSIDSCGDISRARDIIIDMREKSLRPDHVARLRSKLGEYGGRIIGFGDEADLTFYRSMKRSGCDEYFVIGDELPLAIDYVKQSGNPVSGRNIVIHTVKSGIGGSLIAAGLGRFLSEDQVVRIVDLDWVHPAVNYWLRLDKTGELHRLCGRGREIDASLARQMKLPVGDHLGYYGGYDVNGNSRFDIADSQSLFEALTRQDSLTIWKSDKSNSCCGNHVLKQADYVILVCELGLASLKSTSDLLDQWQDIPGKKILVVNDPYLESEITMKKFISLFGGSDPIIAIPGIRGLKQQLLRGILPGSEKSRMRKYMRKLACEIDPRYQALSGWWRWG